MMTTAKRPGATDDDHRVIRFRPRTMADVVQRNHRAGNVAPPSYPVNDLSRYQRSHEPDDYRHRMIMNAAAAVFTLLLTGFGIWLAVSISDLRKTQDCILIGRRDCGRIAVPRNADNSGGPANSLNH